MYKFRPVISTRFARFCLAAGTLSGIAALSLGGQTAWADAACTPPANGPTGPAAATFTYQCDGTYAGDWTNAYYAYDPTTGVQTALYTPDYSYDCTTNTWTQGEWDYDAASGAYIENWVAATAPPDQPTNCPVATSDASTTPAVTPDTSAPDSTPDPTTSTSTGTATGSTVDNTVGSQSQSGDASVTDNGTAGDATSGDATTEVTATNLVQTSSSTLSSGTLTFTTDVNGDVNGDLVLDPSTILADASSTNSSQPTSAVGTTSSSAGIDNDIDASATSGDASVTDNGTAGDATSGDADTIVNLINMIDSAVADGQSFIGTINIYGDLNGNILIPQSVIDELLASNADATDPGGTADSATNESIINNIDASATSGDATVANNGTGGNATSGDADTNVTILNLTGSSIIGKNVLLVFVNVLGQWIGMIINAPAGATSAAFGGGITSATPSTGSGAVEADASLSITNNVDASAASGNATVAYNSTGGNATSGDADTAINILDIENSELSLANWFGILFINVFGTWNGNFGILATPTTSSATPSSSTGDATTQSARHTAHFGNHDFATFVASGTPTTASPSVTDAAAVLGDATATPASTFKPTALPAPDSGTHANYLLPALGFFIALSLLAVVERDRLLRRKG